MASGAAARRRSSLTAFTFILPHFVGFFAFTLVPVLLSMGLSALDWDFANPMRYVGLKNFVRLFADDAFLLSLRNTAVYTGVSVPLTLGLALGFALLLNGGVRGVSAFRATVFFPNIASVVSLILVWKLMYHPSLGPINRVLGLLGVGNPPRWTSTPGWSLVSVIVFGAWWGMGYFMVIYLAGLKSIPAQLYESAVIDGAGSFVRLRYITIPMLSPTIFFTLIICFINAFKSFTPVLLLTEGGPGNSSSVLGYFIYKRAFIWQQFGYASAAAVVLFALIVLATLLQFRYQRRWVTYLE